MDVQSVLDAIRQGFAEVREEISDKIAEEVSRQMSVAEKNKYDEAIIHKQSVDLYSTHEDQLLFEEANPQKQPAKGYSRAEESSKASVDSQVV